jgi:hypothetical protein
VALGLKAGNGTTEILGMDYVENVLTDSKIKRKWNDVMAKKGIIIF